jgi:hypothetical protein
MLNKPLIPELLTWCDLDGNRRYEVWRTPMVKSPFHVYYLVGGVEVGKHPHDSETAARKDFEKRVEENQ